MFALATSAFAQSPAPASTSLTKEERDRAVAYLTETQKDFLEAIDGLTDEQWKFKAAPDRWSIAETAEHIAVAEGAIWTLVSEKIMKSPAAPERRDEVKGKDEIIVQAVPDRSRRAEAPERLQPTGKWETQAALAKDFQSTRGNAINYLRETKEDLRSHFEEHPFLKTMDAYQWLLFNGAHTKRHTAQILEIKADPKFPKS
jgi:hypothetical protein